MPLFRGLKRAIEGLLGVEEPLTRERVELRVVCDAKGEAPFHTVTNVEMFPFEEVSIGKIEVTERTKWTDLDKMIIKEFKEFLDSTYAYCELGLGRKSVTSYEVSCDILREMKDKKKPPVKPIAFFTDESRNKIRVYLRGAAQQGAIDAMVFQTRISKKAIEQYLDRLTSTGRILFCGPRFVHNRVEMSFAVRRLAEYFIIKTRMSVGGLSVHIAAYDAMDQENRALGLNGLLEAIRVDCQPNRIEGLDFFGRPHVRVVTVPHVVIIENLQVASDDVNEIVASMRGLREKCKDVPYIIGTFVKPLRAPMTVGFIRTGRF